jgi:hypothetical protein
MKFPDDIRNIIIRKFQRNHQEWLKTSMSFPIEINLDIPTEQEALRQQKDVQTWITAWEKWKGNGSLVRAERCWRILGSQTVPEKLILNEPEDAVSWIGKTNDWSRAVVRYKAMVQRWSALINVLIRHYSFLANCNETDYSRLVEMLKWIYANPDSNLYPRQIPVAGIDSKWLESHKKLVCELAVTIKGDNNTDFFKVCGLKPPPQLIRMRILDPQLRSRIGGLYDISVPCEEAANLVIKPAKVFIVENLQTGLAFQDLPGSVVIMGLGYAVDVLEKFSWLHNTPRSSAPRCIYWGDIDTHGFAILNRARKYFPALESILMDEATLLSHRQLCVEEKKQHPSIELPLLTNNEQKIFSSLKGNVWGQNIRLEQERVCWETAWNVIQTYGTRRVQSAGRKNRHG